jgi:hypothetical protein
MLIMPWRDSDWWSVESKTLRESRGCCARERGMAEQLLVSLADDRPQGWLPGSPIR